MLVASSGFLLFSAIVAIAYNLTSALQWRQVIMLLASLAFLVTFAPTLGSCLPLTAFLMLGYIVVRAIQNGKRKVFLPSLIGAIAVYVWLRKYSLLPSATFIRFPYVTIGLSYMFFRMVHLIVDARDGTLPYRVGLLSYLNYTLNFTTLVSGPIQPYQDFAMSHLVSRSPAWTIRAIRRASERIVIGFFKVNFVALLMSTIQHRALSVLSASQPFDERTLTGVVTAVAYTFYLYFNFSGSMDIVIGVARFLRLDLPENFDHPFLATNFIDFWNRWHITLSSWFKSYVFNPLLVTLMRRFRSPTAGMFVGVLAYFVTFFLVGVWHGSSSIFIAFGLAQGLGISGNKLYQVLIVRKLGRKRFNALAANSIYKAFARGLTFTWFTLSLFFFWSNWNQIGVIVRELHTPALIAMCATIIIGASVVLSTFEAMRSWVLSLTWNSRPILSSNYVRIAQSSIIFYCIVFHATQPQAFIYTQF